MSNWSLGEGTGGSLAGGTAFARWCRFVPPSGDGVCRVCHGCPHAGFTTCWSCAQVLAQVSRPCQNVVPISLLVIPGPLHLVLRRYKGPGGVTQHRRLAAGLAGLVAQFLYWHRRCLGDRWDFLTTVPSSTGRPGRHPLAQSLEMVPWLARQHRSVLEAGPEPIGHAQAADGGYRVSQPVAGARVVIVDDTYTSGARAQSAASALGRQGARVLAIVPIGRVVDPTHSSQAARWWATQATTTFNLRRCCLELRRSGRPGSCDDA